MIRFNAIISSPMIVCNMLFERVGSMTPNAPFSSPLRSTFALSYKFCVAMCMNSGGGGLINDVDIADNCDVVASDSLAISFLFIKLDIEQFD
uniref:Uncharacterized protein n=1 Tax=Romanomermis culicivorax TaxID=13658 RepID=A0A915KTM6_ROMCU